MATALSLKSFARMVIPTGSLKSAVAFGIHSRTPTYEPILTTFETYKGTQYITGAEPIKDKILKRAAYNLAIKVFDIQVEERNRSQSLAYAKDLVCAGKVPPTKLFKQAQKHYEFIKAGTIIS